jgi:hypothetical protein
MLSRLYYIGETCSPPLPSVPPPTAPPTQPTPPPEPVFKITPVQQKITAQPSQQVIVAVRVSNTGGAPGTCIVRVLDESGGVVAESGYIPLGPGDTALTYMSFTAPPQAGKYTWKIAAYNVDKSRYDSQVDVVVEVSSAPPSAPPTPQPAVPEAPAPSALPVVLGVVAGVCIGELYKKRRPR